MRHSRPRQAPDAYRCPVEVSNSGPATKQHNKRSDNADIRLHHLWCLMVFIELTLLILVDAFVLHRGAWHKSWLFWVNLGMYFLPVGYVLVVKFNACTKQRVHFLVCIGSMLMGCFLWVYMDQLYEQYSQLQIRRITNGLRKNNFTVDSQVSLDLKLSDFALFSSLPVFFAFEFMNALQNLMLMDGPASSTALVHLVQVAGFVTVLMCSQEAYDIWSIVAILSLHIVYAISTTFVSHSVRARNLKIQAQEKARQKADSVLNHILKNTMVEASSCLDFFESDHDKKNLQHARDILLRGMSWCKLREVMVKITSGVYKLQPRLINIGEYGHSLVRGRAFVTFAAAVPNNLKMVMDPEASSIILDNAITNAIRHGCPDRPEVQLSVEVEVEVGQDEIMLHGAVPKGRSAKVHFVVKNRANTHRKKLEPWRSDKPTQISGSELSQTVGWSTGVGLDHIATVANLCKIPASLWQDGDEVFFRATIQTTIVEAKEKMQQAQNRKANRLPDGLPQQLRILCMDDNHVARKSLKHALSSRISGCDVETFGSVLVEVEQFKRAVLKGCDIAILDQHLDFPGNHMLGSTIAAELVGSGYKGLVCMRSSNDTAEDQELYTASGAHCVFGNDMLWAEMVPALCEAYVHHASTDDASPSVDLLEAEQMGTSSSTSHLLLSPQCRAASSSPMSPLSPLSGSVPGPSCPYRSADTADMVAGHICEADAAESHTAPSSPRHPFSPECV